MEVVKKARLRFRHYPNLLAECRSEGSVYASCIAQESQMRMGSCQAEFEKLKRCLVKAAAKSGTRM